LDGNMLSRSKGGVTDRFQWDDFGQLKAVTRDGVSAPLATFEYDGFRRRVRKTTPTSTIHYIWDGDQIVVEYDAINNVTQSYSYYPGEDRLFSVVVGPNPLPKIYRASVDAGGDVNGLIRDSNSSLAAAYRYTPWGELEADATLVDSVRLNSLRWRGLPYDPETGLYQMRARYYDPRLRRFISEDPVGLEGGINQYTYGANDPVNHADPTGTDYVCGSRWVLDTSGHGVDHPDDGYAYGHWETFCVDDGNASNNYPLGQQAGGGTGGGTQQNTPCGPVLTQPGVQMAANRVIGRYLRDPAGREFGEELVKNQSGHIYGLPDTRLANQTTTHGDIMVRGGKAFFGTLHSHFAGSRLNMLSDWQTTLGESPQMNKIVVTPDSLFLLPAGQRLYSGMQVTEACGFKPTHP
jgi:RHS repeat-associated protein